MPGGFLDIATTPSVVAAQEANGSRAAYSGLAGKRAAEGLTQNERDFIAMRDSFYLATASQTGWPYVQHRGGPPGFLRVLDDKTLAFADFRGNRQYISLGNSTANDRVALILVDYPNRRRLKIYAHLETKSLGEDAALAEIVASQEYRAKPERIIVLHVDAFDWNCPQHITPRFTVGEFDKSIALMRKRLEHLEAENRALRERVGASDHPS